MTNVSKSLFLGSVNVFLVLHNNMRRESQSGLLNNEETHVFMLQRKLGDGNNATITPSLEEIQSMKPD